MAGARRVVGDYLGCYGRVDLGAADGGISYLTVPFAERASLAHAAGLAVQWVRADTRAVLAPLADQECLLLSGAVTGPVTVEWVRRIAGTLKSGRHAELASVPGELCGCLVTARKVFLFRSASSQEGLLYRRDGALLRWSTDPTDLLDDGFAEFDREAIWRCCRGDTVFIYRNLTPLRPGHIVVVEENATTSVHYDPITPLELPRRTPLVRYADLAYELILEAVRPYAGCGRIGILLSGGMDSGAVLTALVEAGADVVAYHMATEDPLADESGYARAICDHLGVPFVPVMMDHGDGYLSARWTFPHPYNSTAFQWLERIADRIRDDGVSLLTWGGDGDLVFGPVRYGLHDVLFGDLPLREKLAMCQGLVCSRWELSRILRSFRQSFSLLDDCLPIGENARAMDFLVSLPNIPDDRYDEEYIPLEHCADLTIWRPRGIQLCNPWGAKDIRRLAARMPNAYRLLLYQGRMITKPVLRLMLSTRLPARIWRRHGRLWLDSPHKNYVLTHRRELADLIGGPDSQLVRLGLVDQHGLAGVLAEPMSLRRHAATLVSAAMTELFLRSHARTTSTRGEEDHRDVSAAAG